MSAASRQTSTSFCLVHCSSSSLCLAVCVRACFHLRLTSRACLCVPNPLPRLCVVASYAHEHGLVLDLPLVRSGGCRGVCILYWISQRLSSLLLSTCPVVDDDRRKLRDDNEPERRIHRVCKRAAHRRLRGRAQQRLRHLFLLFSSIVLFCGCFSCVPELGRDVAVLHERRLPLLQMARTRRGPNHRRSGPSLRRARRHPPLARGVLLL